MLKFLFSMLSAITVFGATAQTLPYLKSQENSNGKYGYVDKDGKEVLPYVFDVAVSFGRDEAVSVVKYGDAYYLIDRNGNLVTDKRFDSCPKVCARFYTLQGGVYDFSDKLLSSAAQEAYPCVYSKNQEPLISTVLFSVLTEQGLALADWSFRLLSDVRYIKATPWAYEPRVVEFKTADDKYGLMNADGQVLIAPEYDDLDDTRVSYLADYCKKLRAAGMYSTYTDEELDKILIVFAKNKANRTTTLYDVTGHIIAPPQPSKSVHDMMMQSFKKYIIPYLQHKAQNAQVLQLRVAEPFGRCCAVAEQALAQLPTNTAHKSLVAMIQQHGASLAAPNPDKSYSAYECYTKGKAYYDAHDYGAAERWLKLAADQKYTAAYAPLAGCYDMQSSPVLDTEKACHYYMLAIGYAEPSSYDYWFSCWRLGSFFEFGRGGLERNYDSALHFYRQSRDNTLPGNKSTIEQCITSLNEKIRAAAAPSHAASNSNSTADIRVSGDVNLPSYGTIPAEFSVYYRNADGSQICRVTAKSLPSEYRHLYNGSMLLDVQFGDSPFGSFMEQTTGQEADGELVFPGEALIKLPQMPGAIPPPTFMNNNYPTVYFSKDWKRMRTSLSHRAELNIPISAEEYQERYEKLKPYRETLARLAAEAESGGGSGSSSGPVEIQSGMSRAYYESTYRRWESVAESAYRSLTSTGYSIKARSGEKEGGSAGSWQGSNFDSMKSELRKAQRAMRDVRSEAQRAGFTLPQSSMETADVSYY